MLEFFIQEKSRKIIKVKAVEKICKDINRILNMWILPLLLENLKGTSKDEKIKRNIAFMAEGGLAV